MLEDNNTCGSCKKKFRWWQIPIEMAFSGDLFHKKCFEREEQEYKKRNKKAD